MAIILNLPPQVRFKFKNTHLLAFWIGPSHPDMQTLLSPLTEELKSAFLKGIRVKFMDKVIISRTVLVYVDADLRMKQCILNISGPGAICACDKCLKKGQTITLSESKRVVKYITTSINELFELRSRDKWLKDIEDVQAKKVNLYEKFAERHNHEQIVNKREYKTANVNGVKGPCCLGELSYLNHPELCITQPMHCIYVK